MKERGFGCLGLAKGDSVLDAGCGPGKDAVRMAAITGKSGKVPGIDISERMIAIADVKAKGTGPPVSFRTGDVRKLLFPNTGFDTVRIERPGTLPALPESRTAGH